MDKLVLRAYPVRFGDAFLITVPDKGPNGQLKTRHILIDVGNSFSKEGGKDDVFDAVISDILKVLNGSPLDLYVLTHEHMDHTQGLHYANKYHIPDNDLKDKLNVQYSWITASAKDNYYENHKDAERGKLAMERMYWSIHNYLNHLKAEKEEIPSSIEDMMFINNPRCTKDNVDYIKQLTPNTFFVHRDTEISGNMHSFQELRFEIWAPEEDTSLYYGRINPLALDKKAGKEETKTYAAPDLIPPPGVDAGAFFRLANSRRDFYENLLAIDKAANNTSIVLCLEWRGWRLLFTGDAEEKSWMMMEAQKVFKPVHFFKISHHGSHNGTPEPDILDKVFPPGPPSDGRNRAALVSTYFNTYSGVPDEATLALFDPELPIDQRRCEKLYVLNEKVPLAVPVIIEFDEEGILTSP